jgi:hypothetical protein
MRHILQAMALSTLLVLPWSASKAGEFTPLPGQGVKLAAACMPCKAKCRKCINSGVSHFRTRAFLNPSALGCCPNLDLAASKLAARHDGRPIPILVTVRVAFLLGAVERSPT